MSKKRQRILKKRVNRLPPRMAYVLAAKGDGRGGKHRWRDGLASNGAASPVRVIVRNGQPQGDGQ